jgi:hypothetical protein
MIGRERGKVCVDYLKGENLKADVLSVSVIMVGKKERLKEKKGTISAKKEKNIEKNIIADQR